MHYKFPQNIKIDEVRNAISNANSRIGNNHAFIEADRDEIIIFNYLISTPESFPEPITGNELIDREYSILRECRGLTFDKFTKNILARKWHKFFNLNEKEETQEHKINWNEVSSVTSKMDGSMICPVMVSGNIEWHTKMGLTDIGNIVGTFVSNKPNYNRIATWAYDNNKTLLFEFCSRKNRIVIDYPNDQLILLAIRDNITGLYHSY
jgi:RNA ligase